MLHAKQKWPFTRHEKKYRGPSLTCLSILARTSHPDSLTLVVSAADLRWLDLGLLK